MHYTGRASDSHTYNNLLPLSLNFKIPGITRQRQFKISFEQSMFLNTPSKLEHNLQKVNLRGILPNPSSAAYVFRKTHKPKELCFNKA